MAKDVKNGFPSITHSSQASVPTGSTENSMKSIHFSGFTLIVSNGTLRGPNGAFNEHDGTSKYTTARYKNITA
ncbi:MAG TPA: hypothetical protein VHO70_19950 [Chitinispirillaceae bacterium]|nr:hypothetical protein [Chitinispirillaceae bacterium]